MPWSAATMTFAAVVGVVSYGALYAVSTSTGRSQDVGREMTRPVPVRLDTLACAPRTRAAATEAAVIDFKGAISAAFDSDGVYRLLGTVAQDERIGAVALRVDSAGGDSYASKKLYEAVRKLKTACAIPMAAFVGNVATSGGYWLTMAADEVHADTLSTVGAVGVMAVFANEVRKLERQGISQTVIRTGERKWPLMPFVPVAGDDVAKIKSSLKMVLAEFVAAVETTRRGKLKLDRAGLTTGEAWMGAEGHALGLVDGPAEVDAVMARLLGAPPTAYRRHDLAAAASPPEQRQQVSPGPTPAIAGTSR